MSVIAKNTTGSDITIGGVTVSANSNYTLQAADFPIWASSDTLVTKIGDGSIVINDGVSDLGASDGLSLVKGFFPSKIGVNEEPPFAAKKIVVNGVEKNLFKRVHGVSANIGANSTGNIDLIVSYAHAKFTGAEIFGTNLGDDLNFYVLDDANNTYSGAPGSNYQLNQFGFNVKMPPDRYKNTSDYDADVYTGMVIRCEFTNNTGSAKDVHMNVWLHEVKD